MSNHNNFQQGTFDGTVDSEGEEKIVEDLIKRDSYLKTLAQSSQPSKFNQAMNKALECFPAKWRNYIIRTIFSVFMVAGFCLIIYGGPLFLICVVSSTICLSSRRNYPFLVDPASSS